MRKISPSFGGQALFLGATLGAVILLGAPGLVHAQGGAAEGGEGDELEAIEDAMMESVGEPEEEKVDKPKELPEIGEDVLELFVLDRGFYLTTDLGIFLTLAGTRGYSNVQPYLSIKPGFDIGDYFGIQLDLSMSYSSGNPVSNADRKAGDSQAIGADGVPIGNFDATVDYSLISVGAEVVIALRPTTRIAIEPKLGGGYTLIDPPLTNPSSTSGNIAKVDGNGGHFVVGVDFKYLTLLTNFTAGASVNFHGYLGGWGFIPAISVAAVVRYTAWVI